MSYYRPTDRNIDKSCVSAQGYKTSDPAVFIKEAFCVERIQSVTSLRDLHLQSV